MGGYVVGGVVAAGALVLGVWRARRMEFFRHTDFDVTPPGTPYVEPERDKDDGEDVAT